MSDFEQNVAALLAEFNRVSVGQSEATTIAAALSYAAHLLSDGDPPIPNAVLDLLDCIVAVNLALLNASAAETHERTH